MAKEKNLEVVETTEVEVVEETQQKPSLFDRGKAIGSKVIHSKPAKVIGGVGLFVGGVVAGMAIVNSGGDENYEAMDEGGETTEEL